MTKLLPQFDLKNKAAYSQWRQCKLADYPTRLEQLIVRINDPSQLSTTEKKAVLHCIQKTNMVIFAGPSGDNSDKQIPLQIGAQLGLKRLDNNTGADDDGITSLEVKNDNWRKHYIPYTNHQIHWHTDGYYNKLSQQIYALQLHCVRPAEEGGENALMDHEIAYILLRDRDPALITALMKPDAMTIPENRHGDEVTRPDRSGPVFMAAPNGSLHMRYTARKRYVVWAENEITHQAVQELESILQSDSPYIYRATLQSGQGLISNNVLHDRSGFNDNGESPRLLYRLRFFDRISI